MMYGGNFWTDLVLLRSVSSMVLLKETFVSWTTQEKLDLLGAPTSSIRWVFSYTLLSRSDEKLCFLVVVSPKSKTNFLAWFLQVSWSSVKSWHPTQLYTQQKHWDFFIEFSRVKKALALFWKFWVIWQLPSIVSGLYYIRGQKKKLDLF